MGLWNCHFVVRGEKLVDALKSCYKLYCTDECYVSTRLEVISGDIGRRRKRGRKEGGGGAK